MGLIVRILDGFCRWSCCCWVGDCWGEMKVYESHFSENWILTDFFLFFSVFFFFRCFWTSVGSSATRLYTSRYPLRLFSKTDESAWVAFSSWIQCAS